MDVRAQKRQVLPSVPADLLSARQRHVRGAVAVAVTVDCEAAVAVPERLGRRVLDQAIVGVAHEQRLAVDPGGGSTAIAGEAAALVIDVGLEVLVPIGVELLCGELDHIVPADLVLRIVPAGVIFRNAKRFTQGDTVGHRVIGPLGIIVRLRLTVVPFSLGSRFAILNKSLVVFPFQNPGVGRSVIVPVDGDRAHIWSVRDRGAQMGRDALPGLHGGLIGVVSGHAHAETVGPRLHRNAAWGHRRAVERTVQIDIRTCGIGFDAHRHFRRSALCGQAAQRQKAQQQHERERQRQIAFPSVHFGLLPHIDDKKDTNMINRLYQNLQRMYMPLKAYDNKSIRRRSVALRRAGIPTPVCAGRLRASFCA